jgi:hypothetical protein
MWSTGVLFSFYFYTSACRKLTTAQVTELLMNFIETDLLDFLFL